MTLLLRSEANEDLSEAGDESLDYLTLLLSSFANVGPLILQAAARRALNLRSQSHYWSRWFLELRVVDTLDRT